jgi:hypothetical protein
MLLSSTWCVVCIKSVANDCGCYSQVEECLGSGALCSRTPGSWQLDLTVQSLLNVTVINMVRFATSDNAVGRDVR